MTPAPWIAPRIVPTPTRMPPTPVPRVVPTPSAAPPRVPAERASPAPITAPPRIPAPKAGLPRTPHTPEPVDDHRLSPASEHHRDVARLDPYLIAHDHYVIERRAERARIPELVREPECPITRRHPVRRRVKAAQTALERCLEVVGQHRTERVLLEVNFIFEPVGLLFGYQSPHTRRACFCFGARDLGFDPLAFGNGIAVMHPEKVVAGRRACAVRPRTTACHGNRRDKQAYKRYTSSRFHIFVF